MKLKVELEKNDMCKNIIHGRKPFITPKQKTGENNLHELQGNDCGYNEGTICVVNGLRGWFFKRGGTNGKPEPIMLLILPIIVGKISHNFHPLFFIYCHAITYYSILFLKFDYVTCEIAYGSC